MSRLSEFIGVPEGREFKFESTKQISILESTFKVVGNKLLTNYKKQGKWEEANIDINTLVTLPVTLLPEQILTDEERDYLRAVIKPVRDGVISVSKIGVNTEHICIWYKTPANTNYTYFDLYQFVKGTQFKGMKHSQDYTPKELNLED